MIIPSECGFGMLYRLIVTVSSLSDGVSFTSTIFAGFGCCASASGDSLCSLGTSSRRTAAPGQGSRSLPLLPHRSGCRWSGPCGDGSAPAADRFARILGLGRVDDPARLPFADRSVEDHDPVLHRDNRLLWVPPTTCCTFGASSVSFKPPPSG